MTQQQQPLTEQQARRITEVLVEALPYIPGMVPVFTKHLDFRWALGAIPFSGASEAVIGGWCKFLEPQSASRAEQRPGESLLR